MTARNYFFAESENAFRSILPGLLISAISHILIAVIFFYTPGRQTDRRIVAPINVSLVSLPGPYRGPQPAKGKTTVKSAKKPAFSKPEIDNAKIAPAAPEVKKAEIVETPEKVVKTSLKKKTFKTGEVVKPVPKESEPKQEIAKKEKTDSLAKALKEMEKKVDAGRPDSLANALERMKKRVDEQSQARTDQGDESGDEGIGEGGGSGSPGELTPIQAYELEIMGIIQSNWAFLPQLAGNSNNLKSVLIIKVMPNGEIKDVWFEEKSGNTYMDESSQKAVLKSKQLPPLPAGYTGPFLIVGIVFTPTGVQQ
jgi:colicin import membrane protein